MSVVKYRQYDIKHGESVASGQTTFITTNCAILVIVSDRLSALSYAALRIGSSQPIQLLTIREEFFYDDFKRSSQ